MSYQITIFNISIYNLPLIIYPILILNKTHFFEEICFFIFTSMHSDVPLQTHIIV